MQIKISSTDTAAKTQPVISDNALTIPPRTTRTIRTFVDGRSDWNTTGTVTHLEKFMEAASLLISYSLLTIIDKIIAVRVTNTTESSYLIKKHRQIAKFSVVTPHESSQN